MAVVHRFLGLTQNKGVLKGSTVRQRKPPRWPLFLAIALVIVAVLPWRSFQDHPHWGKVGWIPFVSPPVRLGDMVRNFVLFAPLGATISLRVRSHPIATAAASAFLLSFAAETVQLYSHSRFPSATDLTMDVVGAVAAAIIVKLAIQRRELQ
jgi:glycopeptide antibiotics resistance protein